MAIDLKKIKGFFVQQVENESVSAASEASGEVKVRPVVSDTNQTSVIDNKILDSLLMAIQNNNLPGEDYIEFMDALKAMAKISLDEKTKIQTVIATLSTKGLTTEKIIESANYYIKVLENEKEKFNTVLSQEVEKKVKTRNLEISKLEEGNKKNYEKIAQLTAEIEAAKNQILNIKSEIAQADSKIKEAENKFNTAFSFMVKQIQENIKKINSL
jgi:chromosome segregation ATPase